LGAALLFIATAAAGSQRLRANSIASLEETPAEKRVIQEIPNEAGRRSETEHRGGDGGRKCRAQLSGLDRRWLHRELSPGRRRDHDHSCSKTPRAWDATGANRNLLMPGMTGWEVLRALRRLDPKIPVVIVTGADVWAGDGHIFTTRRRARAQARGHGILETTLSRLLGRRPWSIRSQALVVEPPTPGFKGAAPRPPPSSSDVVVRRGPRVRSPTAARADGDRRLRPTADPCVHSRPHAHVRTSPGG